MLYSKHSIVNQIGNFKQNKIVDYFHSQKNALILAVLWSLGVSPEIFVLILLLKRLIEETWRQYLTNSSSHARVHSKKLIKIHLNLPQQSFSTFHMTWNSCGKFENVNLNKIQNNEHTSALKLVHFNVKSLLKDDKIYLSNLRKHPISWKTFRIFELSR